MTPIERVAQEWAEKEAPKMIAIRSYVDIERILVHGYLAGAAQRDKEIEEAIRWAYDKGVGVRTPDECFPKIFAAYQAWKEKQK